MSLRILMALIVLLFAGQMAQAKRVALVIGNNSYSNLPDFRQLTKAVNDARSIRDTLRDDLGFEVSFMEESDFRTMNNGFKNFVSTVEVGDIAFVYFSGHGVSIGGENYLLPSDIPQPVQGEEQRLVGSSFGAEQWVVRLKKRGARAIFMVLDACRDDPFETENGKSIGGPAGLTKMDAAEGVFILFSAGVRQQALDRLDDQDSNPNSVFTRSLIPALKAGGLSQVDLAKRVYKEVKTTAAQIGHEQTPAYYDQIDGYVVLKEGETTALASEPIAADFDVAKSVNSKSGWDAFLSRHGESSDMRVDVAKDKLKKLAMLEAPAADQEVDAADVAEFMRQGGKYFFGRGVEVDKSEGVKWFRKAAEAGDAKGMEYLGAIYEFGDGVTEDKLESVKWYRSAAEAGNAEGMVSLGVMYRKGWGVTTNKSEAVKWFRKAAEAGNARGMFNFGFMYYHGEGVKKDKSEAVKWYRKAAEAGNKSGMKNLANQLRHGDGVAKNIAEAEEWEKKAAAAQ